MQLAQMDAWIKVLISYIPQMVMLAAAILVVRKNRQWFTTTLVVTAALNILLPIAVIMVQNAANQRLIAMQPQLQNVKTQQELQQVVGADSQMQGYGTMKNWFSQGIFLSALAFAVVLFLTLKFLLSKAAPALAGQSAPPGIASSGNAPDATC